MFTKNPKRKIIILALLALAGIGAAIGGSFAAYTSQAYKRGVVRNRDNETVRFTSNYLQACASNAKETDYAGRTILFDKNQTATQLERDIYVYNYANGNESLVSQKDITYKLVVKFSGGNGNEDTYTVNKNKTQKDNTSEGDVYTYTIDEQTLIGRSAKEYKYTITFPASDLDKLKITITAIPNSLSLSATNNQILAAVIAPCTGSIASPFRFESRYVYRDGSSPSDYAGFNYEVSISSGIANATLSWNTKVMEIDSFFLLKIGKTEDDIPAILESGKLEFVMNQADGTGEYLIPFYIKDKDAAAAKVALASWDAMGGMITFKAVSQASENTETSTEATEATEATAETDAS